MKSTELDHTRFVQIGRDLLDVWKRMTDAGEIKVDTERWSVANPQDGGGIHSHLSLVFISLGSKASKTLHAILLLCSHDYGDDAMVLVRSLIETYATLRWIGEESWEQRLYEFQVYASLQGEKAWEALKRNPATRSDPRLSQTDGTHSFLEEARKRLSPSRFKALRSTRPDGSVEASLRRWNEEALYDAWYRIGASAAHGTDHFSHVTASETSGFDLGQGSRWTAFALFGACSLFKDIIYLVRHVGTYPEDGILASIDSQLLAAAGIQPTTPD